MRGGCSRKGPQHTRPFDMVVCPHTINLRNGGSGVRLCKNAEHMHSSLHSSMRGKAKLLGRGHRFKLLMELLGQSATDQPPDNISHGQASDPRRGPMSLGVARRVLVEGDHVTQSHGRTDSRRHVSSGVAIAHIGKRVPNLLIFHQRLEVLHSAPVGARGETSFGTAQIGGKLLLVKLDCLRGAVVKHLLRQGLGKERRPFSRVA